MLDDNREGWGTGADPRDYFTPRQEVTSLSLPFVLALEEPELMLPFCPSPILRLLALIPHPALLIVDSNFPTLI